MIILVEDALSEFECNLFELEIKIYIYIYRVYIYIYVLGICLESRFLERMKGFSRSGRKNL